MCVGERHRGGEQMKGEFRQEKVGGKCSVMPHTSLTLSRVWDTNMDTSTESWNALGWKGP